MRRIVLFAVVAVAFGALSSHVSAVERHVPVPYATIQAAIDASSTGDTIVISEGTYNENLNVAVDGITLRSSDPNDPCVVSGTIINGGYSDSVIRVIDCNVEIEGLTITNGKADAGGGIKCTSSRTVTVYIRNCNITSNRTTNGADATPSTPGQAGGNGGGVYCSGAVNLEVLECVVVDNTCGRGGNGTAGLEPFYDQPGGDGGKGGGIYCVGANLELVGCLLTGNQSGNGGNGFYVFINAEPGNGGDAGGLYCSGCPLNINECVFALNRAGSGGVDRFVGGEGGAGGGIYCVSSSASIRNSYIVENISGYAGDCWVCAGPGLPCIGGNGGGTYCEGTIIENCLIVRNIAAGEENEFGSEKSGDGGGIYCTNTTIKNCTIADNTINLSDLGGSGGGIYNSSGTSVIDSIVWGNYAQSDPQISGTPTVGYSDVHGGYSGTGNISTNPLFVSGPFGDYYLSQITAGQAVDSPCVDAGSDTSVSLGLDEFVTRTDNVGDAGTVDMGYHYRVVLGDLNKDGKVNFVDFAILAGQWQSVPGIPSADIAPIGGNGIVDKDDLDLMLKDWMK